MFRTIIWVIIFAYWSVDVISLAVEVWRVVKLVNRWLIVDLFSGLIVTLEGLILINIVLFLGIVVGQHLCLVKMLNFPV
jgi:hypothetical protein